MVIWILDFCTDTCKKVHPDSSLKIREENDTEFDDDTLIEVWLDNHSEETGYRQSDCLWMIGEDEDIEEIFIKEE